MCVTSCVTVKQDAWKCASEVSVIRKACACNLTYVSKVGHGCVTVTVGVIGVFAEQQ